jgi:hypothetical protein
MICFLEHDKDGNIHHVQQSPNESVVPVANRLVLPADTGIKLEPPVEIDVDTFKMACGIGIESFRYDAATKQLLVKA